MKFRLPWWREKPDPQLKSRGLEWLQYANNQLFYVAANPAADMHNFGVRRMGQDNYEVIWDLMRQVSPELLRLTLTLAATAEKQHTEARKQALDDIAEFVDPELFAEMQTRYTGIKAGTWNAVDEEWFQNQWARLAPDLPPPAWTPGEKHEAVQLDLGKLAKSMAGKSYHSAHDKDS